MSDPQNPTIFGKILRGEIPSQKLWEDELCIAFRDITPAAPTHILVIPRKYIETLNHTDESDEALIGHLVLVATRLAKSEGIAESGYRLVVNCNADGGQSVYHLHVHLLGGRKFGWPPG